MNRRNDKARGPGRPPKFREKRQPVTMTLPLRVLEILRSVDHDRARAVAKLAARAADAAGGKPSVEVVEMAPHRGLIVVSNHRALEGVEGLRLVEIAPSRFLITLDKSLSMESLEIALQDLLDESAAGSADRAFLAELLALIRRQRRGRTVSREEILIVNS